MCWSRIEVEKVSIVTHPSPTKIAISLFSLISSSIGKPNQIIQSLRFLSIYIFFCACIYSLKSNIIFIPPRKNNIIYRNLTIPVRPIKKKIIFCRRSLYFIIIGYVMALSSNSKICLTNYTSSPISGAKSLLPLQSRRSHSLAFTLRRRFDLSYGLAKSLRSVLASSSGSRVANSFPVRLHFFFIISFWPLVLQRTIFGGVLELSFNKYALFGVYRW